MPSREGWLGVPFEPGPETVIRIGWISAALGFLIAIVSGVGEYLGWWNLVGEIGMTVGSLLGIIATFSTLSLTAGRGQMHAVQETLGSVDDTMGEVEETVGSVDETTAANHQLLQANHDLLERQADLQQESSAKLDKLDVIEAELDRQTGVLDRQVEVLEAIRDGL
ncbi:hypothetical protein BRD56_03275 [Thermoplasmatales archaeon SW_10_69_26]|nr:MAG: hypothetical protein BRD56_03275 [Thermoplasmatales archaeon SW_10_69_26]